ncbi:MAG: nuclease-related domain-containing protein [Jatrophihabitantaceae bacterium]
MTQIAEHRNRLEPDDPRAYSGRHARSDAAATEPRHTSPDPGEPPPRHLFAECEATPVRTVAARLEIARRLATLGAQWRLLHSVPLGPDGGRIDHLVIGPSGVFTINTKHHPGAKIWVRGETFKVDDEIRPYVGDSRAEAASVARVLSTRAGFDVEVGALIAVIGAPGAFTLKAQATDGRVNVLTRKEVVPHLWSLPEVLGAPSVERIHDVARDIATWQSGTVDGWSEVAVAQPA